MEPSNLTKALSQPSLRPLSRELAVSSKEFFFGQIKEMGPSEYLSEDLMMEILSWLPPKSLIRFKCVNKYWYNCIKQLIGDRDFVAKHLRNANNNIFAPQLLFFDCTNFLEDKPYKAQGHLCLLALFKNDSQSVRSAIVDFPVVPGEEVHRFDWLSHCNGIICLGDDFEFKLWNPALQEVKNVLKLNSAKWRLKGKGFGYDPIGDDYKIVIITSPKAITTATITFVYSLNSGFWKPIAFPIQFNEPLLQGVYCDGNYYWLTQCSKSCNVIILCFNMSVDKFSLVEVPYCDSRTPEEVLHLNSISLAVFNDRLALFSFSCLDLNLGIKVWIMHVSYCNGREFYNWDKYSDISFRPGIAAPLMFWTNNEILIRCINGEFLSFNFGTQSFRRVVINRMGDMCYIACPYVRSLVSVVKRARGQSST